MESTSMNADRSGRASEPDRQGASRSRPGAAAIAFAAAVACGIGAAVSPAANLLLLLACVLAFGAGAGLLVNPPLRSSLPKDRVALRVLLGVTAAGALLVVLLPILGRTGLW